MSRAMSKAVSQMFKRGDNGYHLLTRVLSYLADECDMVRNLGCTPSHELIDLYADVKHYVERHGRH